MPHGYVYVLLPTVEILRAGDYAYTYFAGSFYHCPFCCNGISYDPEGGMSMVMAPAFHLYLTCPHYRHMEPMATPPLSPQMSNEKTSLSPILNNPYEEPRYHYDADLNGNLDYNKILEGRRPYYSHIGIAPNRPESALFTNDDVETEDQNAPFINLIREEVKKWRMAGYPKATRVTRELLDFWFNNPERQNFHKLFFCQREAVETAVYLNEIADLDPNIGREILRQLNERVATVSDSNDDVLPRTAFKMATGTGKTVVMAMLILYNYINKKVNLQDTRFADHFLIVAPGITIRDRLGVLFVDESTGSDFTKTDYYHVRNLIPRTYEAHLGGLNSSITITNYHQFEPKVYSGKKSSPLDGKLVYRSGEGMIRQSDKESYSSVISRVLGRMPKSKRILVINDEAHHCYLPRTKERKGSAEEETENENAMVWYEGLRQLKKLGYKLRHVYDLSATPYYLKGSGYVEYSLFPWVVSDFGLVDAIESGLVKIPFLPAFDDSHELDEPVLRNIYEHISKELPKKGQKKARKEAKEKEEEPKGETPPNLPSLLGVALDQFVKDYEEYDRGTRQEGEESANVFSTPPVFIVVCNNTTVSKEVFKYIAGYETIDADGNTIYIDGHFPIFSNYKDGIPLHRQPSLLIDSAAIDNAGGVVSDEFKKVFREEIENFKREYAQLHGAGSADALSEGDILREVVNSVGKPGTLGAHIKCVVSVSMLTEGWDANTVTHILGVRAFGSQLLCEQVAGRALRRRSYELLPYNKKTGEEIDSKDLRRYRPENIIWKFPPEYAHIIGVPFKTFKGGGTGTPPPSKPRIPVFAMHERRALEIRFPNIVGYRCETKEGDIPFDYTGLSKFRMNFNEIPTETVLESAVTDREGGRKVVLKSEYDSIRDAQVIFQLSRDLIREKYTDTATGRQFHKFARLRKIVESWYYNQVEVVGGDGSADLRRLVVFFDKKKVVASIYEGIKQASGGEDRISAILNYYNPEGSTRHVHNSTTKPVYATAKSHVNYVVADTGSWEQIAAKTFEEMRSVICYVKNQFLDFRIPYIYLDEEHDFIPDFIAKVKAPSGEIVNLIVEISGWSNDQTGRKAEKRKYTADWWVPAANRLATHGRWDFIEVSDIDNTKAILLEKISQL